VAKAAAPAITTTNNMRRPSALAAASAAALALLTSASSPRPVRQSPHVFHHENVLGTSLELRVESSNLQQARAAEQAALAEIDRLAQILSAYNPASEFSRWNQTQNQPFPASQELRETLALFDLWRAESNGALNPAAEGAVRLWKLAASQNRLPTQHELAAAAQSAQQSHWTIHNQTLTRTSRAPLALNSLAKSYIVDKAAAKALQSPGVQTVLLNIGGDLAVRGRSPQSIFVANPLSDAENAAPLATVQLTNQALATSGSYRRNVSIAGNTYSHIVDPRTSQPASHILSSTVAARDAATAGALATALSVLPPNQGIRLAQKHNASYLLLLADGSRLASPNWKALAFAPLAAQAPQMETILAFSIARVEGGRYRRPYVAAWVEDKDRFPVRTLAVWVEKTRWLPDLKSWYRSDRMRSLAEGSEILPSVSSATRPPGKYSLKWDGKDNAGKPVKPGKYTVYLEAAREHGTYQIVKHEIDLGGPPQKFDLGANTELESATLEYRKAQAN
jgi:FAD:protein FMN transferase